MGELLGGLLGAWLSGCLVWWVAGVGCGDAGVVSPRGAGTLTRRPRKYCSEAARKLDASGVDGSRRRRRRLDIEGLGKGGAMKDLK